MEDFADQFDRLCRGWEAARRGFTLLSITLKVEKNSCSAKNSDLVVEFYTTQAGWQAACTEVGFPQGQCRSYALPHVRTFRIDPSMFATPPKDLIAHEYGHMLGLADVYDDPVGTSGIEARNEPSIMGRGTSGGRWTEDDSRGIHAAWNSVLSGKSACGEGTNDVTGTLAQNRTQSRFCLPTAGRSSGSTPTAWHVGSADSAPSPNGSELGDARCRPGDTFDPRTQLCWATSNPVGAGGVDPCAAYGLVLQGSYGVCCPKAHPYNPYSGYCEQATAGAKFGP